MCWTRNSSSKCTTVSFALVLQVSSTRAAIGIKRIFFANRHMVNRLHLRWNAYWSRAIHWRLRNRSNPANFQVITSTVRFHLMSFQFIANQICAGLIFRSTVFNFSWEFSYFSVLGEPSEEMWPGVKRLRFFRSFPDLKVTPLETKCLLRGQGFHLLKMMLWYNPNERITAKQILKHPYFNDSIKLYPPLTSVQSQSFNVKWFFVSFVQKFNCFRMSWMIVKAIYYCRQTVALF